MERLAALFERPPQIDELGHHVVVPVATTLTLLEFSDFQQLGVMMKRFWSDSEDNEDFRPGLLEEDVEDDEDAEDFGIGGVSLSEE